MKMCKPEHSIASNPNNIIDFSQLAMVIEKRNQRFEFDLQIEGLDASAGWVYSELSVNPFYQMFDRDVYCSTKMPANIIQMFNPKWAA